jgi:hypothetical protein
MPRPGAPAAIPGEARGRSAMPFPRAAASSSMRSVAEWVWLRVSRSYDEALLEDHRSRGS